jgi:creatinine amidohydrolase
MGALELNRMTWKQARDYFKQSDTCLFPMGCNHSHDHIFAGIDNIAADHIARELSERTQTLLIPQLNFGWMQHYSTYEGTISISQEVLKKLLLEVLSDLRRWGIRKVVFINGHGGNAPILEEVGNIVREWGMLVPVLQWWTLARAINKNLENEVEVGPEYGACRTRGVETSLAMALGCVDNDDLYVQEYIQVFGKELKVNSFMSVEYQGIHVPMPMKIRALSKQGPKGTRASVEAGKRILQETNDYCAAFIERIKMVDMKNVERLEANAD